jgi:hypothetical protein
MEIIIQILPCTWGTWLEPLRLAVAVLVSRGARGQWSALSLVKKSIKMLLLRKLPSIKQGKRFGACKKKKIGTNNNLNTPILNNSGNNVC